MSEKFFLREKMKAIIAKKLGMTNYFNDKGEMVSVTLVEAGPCVITQIRTKDKDGYEAVQIGFGEKKKFGKAQEGHLGKEKSRILKEVEMDVNDVKVGGTITCEVFAEGEKIHVTGLSKGKGFAGTIKRHNFHRGPMTHGSRNQRRPGSIGAMYPQHVFKGKKLPGQMGHAQVTVKNLKIEKVDAEKNILAVKGAIPGPNKSLILIKSAG